MSRRPSPISPGQIQAQAVQHVAKAVRAGERPGVFAKDAKGDFVMKPAPLSLMERLLVRGGAVPAPAPVPAPKKRGRPRKEAK